MKILKNITVLVCEKISIKPENEEERVGLEKLAKEENKPKKQSLQRTKESGYRQKRSVAEKPEKKSGKNIKIKSSFDVKPSAKKPEKKSSGTNPSQHRKAKAGEALKGKNLKAPEGSEFQVIDGSQVKDLKQLAAEMDKISREQFNHHTKRGDGNDFENWIRGALGEEGLAQEIAKMNTRKGLKKLLELYMELD
ncbi:MAG: hypothetical protein ACOCUF_03405 [Patescibacteria group bacterium]